MEASADGRYPIQSDGRYPVEEEERVRVGDPRSVVLPGDINPVNAMPYQKGQFAPSPDELTENMLRAASDAGLLPNDLPIYDEDGNFSPALLEEWDPSSDLIAQGITVDDETPKYNAVVALSTLQFLKGIPRSAGLASIRSASREEIRGRNYGVIIVASRYKTAGGDFKGSLEIYPDFYKFISTPLSPRIEGQATGVSVASYALIHAIGHLFFARLSSSGRLGAVSSVLGEDVWVKDRNNTDPAYEPANFLGAPANQLWKRQKSTRSMSALSKSSPSDDFAETFALYLTNPDFLDNVFPEKYDAMKALVDNVL